MEDLLSEESRILNRERFRAESCSLIEPFQKETKKGLQLLHDLCNDQKDFLSKEEQPQTLLDLIDLIIRRNINSVSQLLSLFPEVSDQAGKGLYSRPFIFEALWKIIFLLDLDGIPEFKKHRTFIQRLENRLERTVEDYLQSSVNEGNKSGIADLMFTISEEKKSDRPVCDGEYVESVGEAILISSKYYKKEQAISKYDIDKIIVEANRYFGLDSSLNQHHHRKYSIVLLVKNKNDLYRILNRSQKENSNYIKNKNFVRDQSDLEVAFKKLLYYIRTRRIKLKNLRSLSWYTKSKPKQILNHLRFHQDYIVQLTGHKIEQDKRKFIWGAVPRSGKSYMVGGLIARDTPDIVILILAAVSETKSQFIDMFHSYSDFEDYKIIDMQIDKTRLKELRVARETGFKCIIVCSQEFIRQKFLDPEIKNSELKESKPIDPIINELDQVLLDKNTYLFFDEAHQGTTDLQQMVLRYFNKFKPVMVLVTATYFKPMQRYGFDLITWTYENQIQMKQFDTYERPHEVFSNPTDSDIFNHVLTNWKDRAEEIAQPYDIFPELVMYSSRGFTEEEIIQAFKTAKSKFLYQNKIQDLLDTIHSYYRQIVSEHGIAFNGTGSYTSQLWFLPTIIHDLHKKYDMDNEEDQNDSHYELISRLLALAITQHQLFNRFNIAIVHSLKSDVLLKEGGEVPRLRENNRVFLCNGKDIKKQLLIAERISNSERQCLIILTGKRLRLGVSLQCVDLAIHFDPIQSIDTIYQSMFRVLTERKGKPYGYFIDLIPDRNKIFLYELTRMMKSGPLSRDKIAHTLYLFNVNGIDDQLEKGQMLEYDKIIRDFTGSFHHMVNNIVKDKLDYYKRTFVSLFRRIKPERMAVIRPIITELFNEPWGDKLITHLFDKLTFIFSLYVLYNNKEELKIDDIISIYETKYDMKNVRFCQAKIQPCYMAFMKARQTNANLDMILNTFRQMTSEELHVYMSEYAKLLKHLLHDDTYPILYQLFESIRQYMSSSELSIRLHSEMDMFSSQESKSNQESKSKESKSKESKSKQELESENEFEFESKEELELREDLEPYFKLEKEEKDGNCLFRALSNQIYGNPEEYNTIRQRICDYLEDNPKLVFGYDPQEYIPRMRTEGEWGGQIEIIVCSRIYNRCIKLYNSRSSIEDHSYYTEFKNPIYLYYLGNNHYNSLRLKVSDQDLPPLRQEIGIDYDPSELGKRRKNSRRKKISRRKKSKCKK